MEDIETDTNADSSSNTNALTRWLAEADPEL
jgi:hypothetical protein